MSPCAGTCAGRGIRGIIDQLPAHQTGTLAQREQNSAQAQTATKHARTQASPAPVGVFRRALIKTSRGCRDYGALPKSPRARAFFAVDKSPRARAFFAVDPQRLNSADTVSALLTKRACRPGGAFQIHLLRRILHGRVLGKKLMRWGWPGRSGRERPQKNSCFHEL
jgi:hypothetical protein